MDRLRALFREYVGRTLVREMIKSMLVSFERVCRAFFLALLREHVGLF